MAKFNIDKKGYNTTEVDEYITNLYLKYEEKLAEQKDRVVALKNEVETLNERLSGFLNKDEQISKALIYAVEKSEQIENNAKTVYNLEIKRINALYSRWEELLLEIENHCPELNNNKYKNSLMKDFKNTVSDINSTSLEFNTKGVKEELKQNSDNFIRNILNRMDYVVNSKPISIAQPKKQKAKVQETAKKEETVAEKEETKVTEKPTKKEKVAEKPAAKKSKPVKKEVENKEVKPETKVEPKVDTVEEKPVQAETQPAEVKKPEPSAKGLSALDAISKRLSMLNKKTTSSDSMAEKYLNSDDDLKINAYAKNFTKKKLEKKSTNSADPFNYMEYPEPNESGFDLKDALNPKEDLDEIMKSFDFFDEDQ